MIDPIQFSGRITSLAWPPIKGNNVIKKTEEISNWVNIDIIPIFLSLVNAYMIRVIGLIASVF